MTVLTIPDTRQTVLAALADYDYSDFGLTTVALAVFALPQAAIVVGGEVTTHNVLTGSGTVAMTVGDSVDDDRYLASVDVKSAVISSPVLVSGYRVLNATRDVEISLAYSGTLTAGDGQIIVQYIGANRSSENFE